MRHTWAKKMGSTWATCECGVRYQAGMVQRTYEWPDGSRTTHAGECPEWVGPDPEGMTPAQINRELDNLDKRGEVLTQELIDAGRGNETPSETRLKSDALARRWRVISDRQQQLRREIIRRWGPGAPSRLPTWRGGRTGR